MSTEAVVEIDDQTRQPDQAGTVARARALAVGDPLRLPEVASSAVRICGAYVAEGGRQVDRLRTYIKLRFLSLKLRFEISQSQTEI